MRTERFRRILEAAGSADPKWFASEKQHIESKPPAKPEVWSGPIRAYYGRSPLRGPKGLLTAFLSRATP